jgi:hypothetical protein
MIDRGVPASRDEWAAGVLAALGPWEQGDLVSGLPLFYFADRRYPTFAATRSEPSEEDDDEPPETIVWLSDDDAPPFGMVTTQTCDIAEEDSAVPCRPWIQLAPVYATTDKGWRKKIPRGRGPRYLVHVPGIESPKNGIWLADLRVEVPVEKGWLAQQERIPGGRNTSEKWDLANRIASLRNRPVFAQTLVQSVDRPLATALRDLAANDEALFEQVEAQIEEIIIRADDFLAPSMVWPIVMADGDAAIGDDVRNWFGEWWESAQERATDNGITLHPVDFQRHSEMSASDYRKTAPLHRFR